MYATAWVHIVLYIILAGVGEAIMVVVVGVAMAMTEVVRTEVVTAQDVAVGRLGSDVARIVVGGYLGKEFSMMDVSQEKQGQGRCKVGVRRWRGG